jgi:hypothetical protein
VDVGVIARAANGNGVHDSPGFAFGGHVRGKILKWLDVRVAGRTESCPYSYDDGAFGLPSGTQIDQPGPRRIYLAAALEPNWSPIPRLELWAGVGIGWGRTVAPTMQTSGAEEVLVPTRAAVFVEVPFSLGVRYEIIPYWLVANLSASVAFPGAQSGVMLGPYHTPGKDGTLVTVGGFPELGVSWLGLAGLGVLL